MKLNKIVRYSSPAFDLGTALLCGYASVRYNNIPFAIIGLVAYTNFIDSLNERKLERMEGRIKTLESKLDNLTEEDLTKKK